MDIQLQFDPFSFVIACIAALIAWRAHFLAKVAPARERTQRHRDEVRTSLIQLDSSCTNLAQRLQMGVEVTRVTNEFALAMSDFDITRARLPEQDVLSRLASSLAALRETWIDTSLAEGNFGRAQSALELADAMAQGPDVRDAASAKAERERLQGVASGASENRSAWRARLASDVTTAQHHINAYKSELDRQDRNATDGWWAKVRRRLTSHD